ncbi:hypothetical protein [Sphingobium yanoikuyae]|uniref:hypothetical protein n=1 Tax=Sphingobium yanoikuyae TaxID=13690 RepID=UPI000A3E8BD6|nr:hypothetical protein [Sphingobium yanoikuyae]
MQMQSVPTLPNRRSRPSSLAGQTAAKIEHDRALYKQRNRIERGSAISKSAAPSPPAMINWPTASSA